MKTIKIKLYKFDELSQQSKDVALIDHIEFLIETGLFDEKSAYWPAVQKMQQMQTPWFLGETLFHDYKDALIEDIKINDYDFTKDGKFYPNGK